MDYQDNLEMDIEKCFDRISHQAILEKTELPKAALKGLRLAIKAGVRGEYPVVKEGTPQGGVISPLLANIALNGIEDCFKNKDITCLRYA
jgi:retron-type reverse transcriptase